MDGILELLFEIIGEVLIEFILNRIAIKIRDGNTVLVNTKYPALYYVILSVIGIIIGSVSALILPNRILPAFAFNGISIIVSPLLVGIIMMLIGIKDNKNGKIKTRMLTFTGGFLFALGISISRWILVNNII